VPSGLARIVGASLALAAAASLLGSPLEKKAPKRRTPTATRTPSPTPTPVPPAPEEVLRTMADVYAKCGTYRDEGVVRMTFHEKAGDRLDERPFTTEFVRPDYFRFEYRDRFSQSGDYRRNLVWWDGKQAWTSFSFRPKPKKARSLDEALSDATGVSGGSAHRVPKLLLPDRVTGRTIVNLRDPKLEGMEPIAEKECYRLTGLYAPEDPRITVWIETDSHLLRRVSGASTFPEFSLDVVTDYAGSLDADVPRKATP